MRAAVLASVAGVALGALWMASPLTIVFGALTVWMCARAVRRLEGRERAIVTRILAVAVGVRFLAIAVLLLATRPDREPFLTLFPDARFLLDRSLWIRNLWLGIPIGPHQSEQLFGPYAASSYPYVLAVIQTAAGPSPYGLCLLSVALFTAGALMTHAVVRDRFGSTAATVGLVALMFWPTLFAWSISVLRESSHFFLGAVGVLATFYLVRGDRLAVRLASGVALVASLAALSTLQSGIAEIGVAAVAFAVAMRAVAFRPSLLLVFAVVALVAVVRAEDRFLSIVRVAASRHIGYINSEGQSYRLLGDQYYQDGPLALDSMGMADATRYLLDSAVAFVIEPAPWRTRSLLELAIAPQQIAWYGVVVAAVVGAFAGFRRDAWLTCVLVGYALAGLVVIAPNSGNVGTLVRHRDMIAPFAIWLGALGITWAAAALPQRVSPAMPEASWAP